MARIERQPLASALARYTEWIEMAGRDINDDQTAWLEPLAQPQNRERVFEEEIIPEIERRFEPAMEAIRTSHAGFTFEYHSEYFSDSPELLLTIHFRNRFAPESPCQHIYELAAGLNEIVEETVRNHPEITRVQCASWLNNRQEFLQLFPKEWTDGRTLCLPMEGSAGWWGSFIDREGNFNAARAETFRQNGGFSMPNIHCRCSLDALQAHLKQLLR